MMSWLLDRMPVDALKPYDDDSNDDDSSDDSDDNDSSDGNKNGDD